MNEERYFNFKDPISLRKGIFRWDTYGTVFGKLEGKDAYVVTIRTSHNNVAARFGYPNRHLKLEWGAFTGSPDEFIISVDDLELRQK